MTVYRTSMFDKRTKKLKIPNAVLLKAANEVQQGIFEADLGGGVMKKRISLNNQGKSGGARIIIFF